MNNNMSVQEEASAGETKIILLVVAFVIIVLAAWLYFFKINLNPVSSADMTGITDEKILIGTVAALTGHVSFFGEYVNGANAYIKKINSAGGVFGRKLEIISYDDQYDPEKTVYYTQKLINDDKVFALLNFVGTPTGTKIVPLVEEAKIPLFGIGSGAQFFREPIKKYIYNLRSSYHQEADAFIKGMVEDLGIKKIAVFYQYDAYGFDGLKGAEISLDRYGLKPVVTASYERGTLNIEEALETIKNSQAEAVFIVGVYSPTAKFIKLARSEGYNPIFGNLSFTGSEELVKELGIDGNGVVVTQVVPPPTEKNLLIGVDDYIKDLNELLPGHEPSFSGLEGYADAEVFVEGIRRAGKDLTREKLISALESIRNFDLGLASPVNFSATDHQGIERVYFTYIKDGKFILFSDWAAVKSSILNNN